MHTLLGLLAILAGLFFWHYWNRVARSGPRDRVGGGSEIRQTIQRLMNQGQYDIHPADSVDDARLAASGLIVVIATMDAPLSQNEISALSKNAQTTFGVTEREALDIVSYGRWVAGECGSVDEGVRRLSRRINKLAGPEAGADTVRMIEEVASADGIPLGEAELEAMETVRNILNVA